MKDPNWQKVLEVTGRTPVTGEHSPKIVSLLREVITFVREDGTEVSYLPTSADPVGSAEMEIGNFQIDGIAAEERELIEVFGRIPHDPPPMGPEPGDFHSILYLVPYAVAAHLRNRWSYGWFVAADPYSVRMDGVYTKLVIFSN